MENKLGVQATKVLAPTSATRQLVVRRINWAVFDAKELTEPQVARRFCDFNGRSSWTLQAMDVDNPVDVRAISPDGLVGDYQIVRLWDQADWQKLNTNRPVDDEYDDEQAIELFRKVGQHKGAKKYPDAVRKNLILLIDANPIESVARFIEGAEDAIRHHVQVGYNAVWAVGTKDSCKID